jgi:hypothetical protein
MAENTAPENPNPPASVPPEGEEKITIANEEEYEKAMAKASSSENPALYKSKVEAAYQETLSKEAAEKEAEEGKTGKKSPDLTGADLGIGPGSGVGASGTKAKKA